MTSDSFGVWSLRRFGGIGFLGITSLLFAFGNVHIVLGHSQYSDNSGSKCVGPSHHIGQPFFCFKGGDMDENNEPDSSSDWDWSEHVTVQAMASVPTELNNGDNGISSFLENASRPPTSLSNVDETAPNKKDPSFRSQHSSSTLRSPGESDTQSANHLPNSNPLATIEKLQQMLDDTDYVTSSRGAASAGMLAENARGESPSIRETVGRDETPLWTSKDRAKYKRTQQRRTTEFTAEDTPPSVRLLYEKAREYRRNLKRKRQQELEATVGYGHDHYSDTEDGLGYTLPNLPVYLSDDEGDDVSVYHINSTGPISRHGIPPQGVSFISHQPRHPQGTGLDGDPTYHVTPSHRHQEMLTGNFPNPQSHVGTVPNEWYPSLTSSQGAQNQVYTSSIPSFRPEAMTPSVAYHHHPHQGPLQHTPGNYRTIPRRHYYPRPLDVRSQYAFKPPLTVQPQVRQQPPIVQEELQPQHSGDESGVHTPVAVGAEREIKRSSRSKWKTLLFNVTPKLSSCILLTSLVCYVAVAPQGLPFVEHNQKFYENMRVASLVTIAPCLLFAAVVDPKQNSMGDLATAFSVSFSVGYVLVFAAQVVLATIVRLGVFAVWETDVFRMCPKVPLLVVPWVLRDQNYLVKPITLITQDFVSSAVVSPAIEEFIKLQLLQKIIQPETNFNWVSRPSKSNPKKRKQVPEPVQRSPTGGGDVTEVNSYISGMLAVSMGLKLADAVRRVCMYTKGSDSHKSFYAFLRGAFPIQELCGTIAALNLARRDVLGQSTPTWKIVLPSIFIHGMANFRGMKPIFKWNSSTPWTEMQLSPKFHKLGELPFDQLAARAFPKIMWLIILCRVTGYCIKNYYMINRQALRRTTTYAGNPAAFSAELAATEMLKSTKKER